MNPNLMHAVIDEPQNELERQAGCCTPAAQHRREVARHSLLGRITARRRSPTASGVCCA